MTKELRQTSRVDTSFNIADTTATVSACNTINQMQADMAKTCLTNTVKID